MRAFVQKSPHHTTASRVGLTALLAMRNRRDAETPSGGHPEDAKAVTDHMPSLIPDFSLSRISIYPRKSEADVAHGGERFPHHACPIAMHNFSRQPLDLTGNPSLNPKQCGCGGGCPKCRGHRGEVGIQVATTSADTGEFAQKRPILPHPDHETHFPSALPLSAQAVVGHGGGRPLDERIRASMEPLLSVDLGRVRTHTGSLAEASAASVNALAYTVGHEIVFGAGQFAPDTYSGRWLLGHELAHVVQQRQGVGGATSGAEAEAETTGARVASGQPVHIGSAAAHCLQRKPAKETAEEKFKKSKEWRAYVKAAHDLKAKNEEVAEAQRKLRLLEQRHAEAVTQLETLKSQRVQTQGQLAAARVEAARTAEVAKQKIEEARKAAIVAEESRKSAHFWGRLSGVASLALHSLEALVACPLSETGIGAVGCIHATTSMYADTQQVASGDLTPNLFFRAGSETAKAFGASPETASGVGQIFDTAGGFTSASAALSAGSPPARPSVVPEPVPQPPVSAPPPAKPVITAHADLIVTDLNEMKYPTAVETARGPTGGSSPKSSTSESGLPTEPAAETRPNVPTTKEKVSEAATTKTSTPHGTTATATRLLGSGEDLR